MSIINNIVNRLWKDYSYVSIHNIFFVTFFKYNKRKNICYQYNSTNIEYYN